MFTSGLGKATGIPVSACSAHILLHTQTTQEPLAYELCVSTAVSTLSGRPFPNFGCTCMLGVVEYRERFSLWLLRKAPSCLLDSMMFC